LLRWWRGAWVAFAAGVWTLWLPVLVFLLVQGQFTAALVWFALPSVFLGAWYGWARAMLAPLGIYAILPRLFRGAVGAVTNRHFEWKGRVI